MSDLRSNLIRLASAHPEFRAQLLPLLREAMTKKAHGSGAANAAYLNQSPLKDKILRAVAKHYGVSISKMEAELTDPDAEAVYEYIGNDPGLQMQVYRDFKAKGPFLAKQAADPEEKTAEMDKVDEPLEKTAATKTAGSIFFHHPVGVLVRVTQARPLQTNSMDTAIAGVLIISLSSSAPMAPVQFAATVRPSAAGWQVVSFRTRQSVSGGASDALLGICREFFAAALSQKGDQLLHQDGTAEVLPA